MNVEWSDGGRSFTLLETGAETVGTGWCTWDGRSTGDCRTAGVVWETETVETGALGVVGVLETGAETVETGV